jgi:hypothetical protein
MINTCFTHTNDADMHDNKFTLKGGHRQWRREEQFLPNSESNFQKKLFFIHWPYCGIVGRKVTRKKSWGVTIFLIEHHKGWVLSFDARNQYYFLHVSLMENTDIKNIYILGISICHMPELELLDSHCYKDTSMFTLDKKFWIIIKNYFTFYLMMLKEY